MLDGKTTPNHFFRAVIDRPFSLSFIAFEIYSALHYNKAMPPRKTKAEKRDKKKKPKMKISGKSVFKIKEIIIKKK